MMRFSRRHPVPRPNARPAGFEHLTSEQVYLDSACQTQRPQPVIDAMEQYFHDYNACGERVKYEWGTRVDEAVADARRHVLAAFGQSARTHATSFTLNTTYGINLLLTQLPAGRFRSVLTTRTEHNSVFLPTIAFARRHSVPRTLLARDAQGRIEFAGVDLHDALVVVSAMNNFDGILTPDLPELIDTVHAAGGAVILDAAQAAPHALSALRGSAADAICWSAHKMYGPSLGVVVATRELLDSLEPWFVGGGQVASVAEDDFDLLPELETRLEAGLQPWGEIIGLGAALRWLDGFEASTGEPLERREERLAQHLFDGLAALPNLTTVNAAPAAVISVIPERVDGHRLATFLSRGGVMVRSGYFCAHHWLLDQCEYRPLVRFSLGAHNTMDDVDSALGLMSRLMKGL